MGASGCQEVYEWYILENYIYLCSFFIIWAVFLFLEQFLSEYSQSMACENVNRYGNVLGKLFTVLWP